MGICISWIYLLVFLLDLQKTTNDNIITVITLFYQCHLSYYVSKFFMNNFFSSLRLL